MTNALREALLAPDRKDSVVADCLALLDQQIADLSGLSGTAIKVAYKSVTKFAPDHVYYTVDSKLPRMIDQLEPYWAEFNGTGGADFGDYLTKHGEQVTQDLLSVTDASAAGPTARPVIVKAYTAVRGHAAKHVTDALPSVGALVQRHASLSAPDDRPPAARRGGVAIPRMRRATPLHLAQRRYAEA
jgi:hypothetical protein